MVISSQSLSQINDAIKFKIIAPDGWYDETIVRMHDSATVQFDPMWDAWKMFTPNNAIPSLYTYSAEQWSETINAIPFPVKDSTMALMMRTIITGGQFTMEVEFQGTFDSEIRVGIKDLVTGDHYLLDNNMSFPFDVTTSPDDYERFHIYFSPAPEITLTENAVQVYNYGGAYWTCQLFDANNAELNNTLVPADSISYTALANGDYYVVSTDAFGFVDTIPFTIFVEPAPSTDPEPEEYNGEFNSDPFLSLSDVQPDEAVTIRTNGDQHYVYAIFSSPKDVVISAYTVGGAMLSNETVFMTEQLEYNLPLHGDAVQPIIIVVTAGQEKHTFKLVY